MSDTQVFLTAVFIIVLCAIGGVRIVEWIQGPKVQQCSVTIKDFNGNKHTFIGKGEVW